MWPAPPAGIVSVGGSGGTGVATQIPRERPRLRYMKFRKGAHHQWFIG
jgi:hypothetical protein